MTTYIKPRNGGQRYRHERPGVAGSGGSNNRHKPRVISDIFSLESPKAYAPLGYISPGPTSAIQPNDFNNNVPLPSYPRRPPVLLVTPLGDTFVDTEIKRPNSSLNRKSIPRGDAQVADPAKQIVEIDEKIKRPLMLGSKPVSEPKIEIGKHVSLESMLVKRERDSGSDDDNDESTGSKIVKKPRREIRLRFDDGSEDINNDIVKPENVLRMVDSSLVDTPERDHKRSSGRDFRNSRYSDNRFMAGGNSRGYYRNNSNHSAGSNTNIGTPASYGRNMRQYGGYDSRSDRPNFDPSGGGNIGNGRFYNNRSGRDPIPPGPNNGDFGRFYNNNSNVNTNNMPYDWRTYGGQYNPMEYATGRGGGQPGLGIPQANHNYGSAAIGPSSSSAYDPWMQIPAADNNNQRGFNSSSMGGGLANYGGRMSPNMANNSGMSGFGSEEPPPPPLNYNNYEYKSRKYGEDRRRY